MSHFYGSIQGQAGEATRMGSRNSGIGGYVQGHGSRVVVDMSVVGDKDAAYVTLTRGHSNYSGGSLGFTFPDIDAIVNSVGKGDKKIEAIVERLHREVDRLNEEAPRALERIDRKQEREAKRQEREREREERAFKLLLTEIESLEKARLVRVCAPWVELDSNGEFEVNSCYDLRSRFRLRRADDGHLYITTRCGRFANADFDVTVGQWVLPALWVEHASESLPSEEDRMGYGYRPEKEEANVA